MSFDIKKYIYKTKPVFNKHLLFHHTYNYALQKILNTDTLLVKRTCDKVTSISFTRCSYYSDENDERIVLDYNLLKIDGYNTTPYDEVAINCRRFLNKDSFESKMKGYSKANPATIGRYINNKLNTKVPNKMKSDPLEWEYEERIFKDIKNLGKYIISIDININDLKDSSHFIKDYIDKYPHIEITIFDESKPYDRRYKVDFNEMYSDYIEYRNYIKKMVSEDLFIRLIVDGS
jgi:hypothetical protein